LKKFCRPRCGFKDFGTGARSDSENVTPATSAENAAVAGAFLALAVHYLFQLIYIKQGYLETPSYLWYTNATNPNALTPFDVNVVDDENEHLLRKVHC